MSRLESSSTIRLRMGTSLPPYIHFYLSTRRMELVSIADKMARILGQSLTGLCTFAKPYRISG